MQELLNSTIGEYRLVEFLGAGGMGEVYRGVHLRLGREVAIKVLTAAGRDSSMLQRFFNEARIQSNLRHPNIATLHDYLDAGGRPVIVMEYVDGQTFSDRIRSAGPFQPGEAASLMRTVADTVAYLHSQGVIHRDLKNSNIKLSAAGQVKLLDFGIAKGAGELGLTRTGFVVGTFHNLSPEQVQGQPASFASDIWALGVVMYEMIAGRLPFDTESAPELFSKIMKSEFEPLAQVKPDVPRDLDLIIQRCLKKRPTDRYGSAMELRQDLERFLIVSKAPEPVPPSPFPWKWMAAGVGALVLLAIAFFVLRTPGSNDNDVVPHGNGTVTSAGRTGAARDSGTTGLAAADSSLETITVEVIGGSAEVYQNGLKVGSTPFLMQKRFGETVDMLLKRDGYQDLPVQFDVSERHDYSYTMEPRR